MHLGRINLTNLDRVQFEKFNAVEAFCFDQGWYEPNDNTFDSNGIVEIMRYFSDMDTTIDAEAADHFKTILGITLSWEINSDKSVKIKNSSYISHPSFQFIVVTKSKILELIFSEFLEFKNNKDIYTRLWQIEKIRPVLSGIGLEVELSDQLKHKKVIKAVKAAPILTENSNSNGPIYSLQYKITLENGNVVQVQNKDFASDWGYLQLQGTCILISDEIFPALILQKKFQNLDSIEAIPLINNPNQSLFPSGTNTELFDLSEYDARVAGFEHALKVTYKEVVSSGIQWFNSPAESIPFIHIQNVSGTPVRVRISDQILSELITKMEISKDSGILLADGNPRPVSDQSGNLIACTENNFLSLQKFRDELRKISSDRIKNDESKKSAHPVAVLREIEYSHFEPDQIEVNLSREQIEQLIIPGCTMDEHQIVGVNWLLLHYFRQEGGVLLCDDMGLGKTLQLITFLTIIKNLEKFPSLTSIKGTSVDNDRPAMVVAPTILLSNWAAEVQKFLRPEYLPSICILHGAELDKVKRSDGSLVANWWQGYDLIITNYPTFSRYQVDILRVPFSISIFDESQAIKNPDTAQSKAARGLNSQFVVCSTGTPVEIRLLDLWTQIDTLKRSPTHPLGSKDLFQKDYESDQGGKERIRSILKINQADGIMLRRDKTLLQSLGKLPKKTILPPFYVQMTPEQELAEQSLEGLFRKNALRYLQSLQMLYQHPAIYFERDQAMSTSDLIKASPKLEKTLELVNQIKLKNEKVLIFTLWIKMQVLLQRVFSEIIGIRAQILNGEINAQVRKTGKSRALEIIDDFSKKEGFDILILSPLAAGAGLNIVAANHVIHYGRWWNPAKEDQGTDRAYRKGQTKPVYVYYPVLHNQFGSGFDVKQDLLVKHRREMARDILTPIHSLDAIQDFSEQRKEGA